MNKDYLYDNYRLVEFYDDMYMYDDDFELWKEYIKPGMHILEIACGTGRLTKLIAENIKNIKIDALDYSEEMIDLLEKKEEKFKFQIGTSINLIRADMRYYSSESLYDLIIISSNSLNHIELNSDMSDLFKSIYNMLKSGGKLLFDILNPKFSFLIHDINEWHDGRIYYQEKSGKYFYSDEKNRYNYKEQINYVTYRYYYCDKKGNKKIESPTSYMDIKIRLYFPQEMDYYISNTKFKVIDKYDWYDKCKFNGNTSEQIYILQK